MKLDGHKTYLVSLGIVLASVGAFLAGEIDVQTAVMQILAGLGLGTVRHAVAKVQK